jgi:hypothetical protein
MRSRKLAVVRDSDIWRVAPYFVRGSSVLIEGKLDLGFGSPNGAK